MSDNIHQKWGQATSQASETAVLRLVEELIGRHHRELLDALQGEIAQQRAQARQEIGNTLRDERARLLEVLSKIEAASRRRADAAPPFRAMPQGAGLPASAGAGGAPLPAGQLVQPGDPVERCCKFCGALELGGFLDLRDSSGADTRILECRRCSCFIADYFDRWRDADPVESQVEHHEHWWCSESAEQLQILLRDLSTLVTHLRPDLGAPSPDNVVVEIGAGRGGLLKALIDHGYRALGCEPSRQLISLARRQYQLGSDVLFACGAEPFLQELHERGIHPRVIVLWHVLEHIAEPLDLLRKLAAACGPGGRIIIQVPLLASEYVFPQHYFFCTPATISFIAKAVGLDVVRTDVDFTLLFLTAVFEVSANPEPGRPDEVPGQNIFANRADPVRVRDISLRQKSEAIAAQGKMLEERWEAMQKMGQAISAGEELIRQKDEAIRAQASLIEERWGAMQKMGQEISVRDELIRQKDDAIAAQAQLIGERWDAMQQIGREIISRDALIRQKDDTIAAQAALIEERWEAMQKMGREIDRRDTQLGRMLSHPVVEWLIRLRLMKAGEGR
jgi:SAM-dependent methyltransferase